MKTVMKSTIRPSCAAHRGFLSVELLLTLPVLTLILFALFEGALLLLAHSELVEATRFGARKATHPSVRPEDVSAAVRTKLHPRLRNAAEVAVDPGEHSGDVVRVAVRVPMNRAAPDLLGPIGLSLRGRSLFAEIGMIKE